MKKIGHHQPHSILIGDRRFISEGLPRHLWGDLFHRALTVRWPVFFALVGALFLLLNAGFALLYQFGDHPIAHQFPHGFAGAFFFSVETLATVGYGDMHPQTVYAHWVATLEIFTGMGCVALVAGLIFSRFSRPRARMIFASHPVVHTIDGHPTLVIRAANARQNVIAEASATLHLLRYEVSSEGFRLYRIIDLKLVREHHPLFILSWNLMHVIDAESPLHGATPASLAQDEAVLLLTIEGIDETTSQPMRARQRWNHDALRWNHRYRDLVRDEGSGLSVIDYRVFNEVLPLDDGSDQTAAAIQI